MKETILSFTPTERHAAFLALDQKPQNEYKTYRGVNVDNRLGFDFFSHLWQLVEANPDRRIEVLVGGCGQGWEIADLKRGLGDKVKITGITLYEGHLENIRRLPEKLQPDEVIVGPVEQYSEFDGQYDFIYDSYGATFYFPREVIPVYGRMLANNGRAYLFTEIAGDWTSVFKNLVESNGLIIDAQETVNCGYYGRIEALLRKVAT